MNEIEMQLKEQKKDIYNLKKRITEMEIEDGQKSRRLSAIDNRLDQTFFLISELQRKLNGGKK